MKQTQTKEGRGPTRAIKYECTVHAPARGASNAQALLRLNSRSPCPLQFHHCISQNQSITSSHNQLPHSWSINCCSIQMKPPLIQLSDLHETRQVRASRQSQGQ